MEIALYMVAYFARCSARCSAGACSLQAIFHDVIDNTDELHGSLVTAKIHQEEKSGKWTCLYAVFVDRLQFGYGLRRKYRPYNALKFFLSVAKTKNEWVDMVQNLALERPVQKGISKRSRGFSFYLYRCLNSVQFAREPASPN